MNAFLTITLLSLLHIFSLIENLLHHIPLHGLIPLHYLAIEMPHESWDWSCSDGCSWCRSLSFLMRAKVSSSIPVPCLNFLCHSREVIQEFVICKREKYYILHQNGMCDMGLRYFDCMIVSSTAPPDPGRFCGILEFFYFFSTIHGPMCLHSLC